MQLVASDARGARRCLVEGDNADRAFLRRLLALDVCELVCNDVSSCGQTPWLRCVDARWELQLPGERTRVAFDFSSPDFLRRMQPESVGSEAVVRAVRGRRPARAVLSVFDATAGLGRDAMLLAAAGCDVQFCERNPLLALLIESALEQAGRAEQDALIHAAARCRQLQGDSLGLMADWQGPPPQVVYLDPMYAHSEASGGQGLKSSARVNKHMQALQCLDQLFEGRWPPAQAPRLLQLALELATHKVVVKRPPAAPALDGPAPASSLATRTLRFDIYPK